MNRVFRKKKSLENKVNYVQVLLDQNKEKQGQKNRRIQNFAVLMN
jgi:hypothetical protein